MLKLYIGDKNYSSWSMRPWVLLKQAGIPFDEVMIRFDSFEADSSFKKQVHAINPVGKVPVLVDGDVTVWDTLAICEYAAEYVAGHGSGKAEGTSRSSTSLPSTLWPADRKARARARSICAEMHSGFGALRQHCTMNIEARLPDIGALIWRDQPGVRADVARLEQMWTALLGEHGGPMLFGEFSIADAYFAPVCMRLITYALPVSPRVDAYVQAVAALPAVRAWIDGALAEQNFLAFEEPYRLSR